MSASDNRGKAVSDVVIEASKVTVKGTLQDGTPIKYTLSLVKGEGDPFVGRKVRPLFDLLSYLLTQTT